MRAISHREYRDKLQWISGRWNEHSKEDYYLMQIAQMVDGVLKKRYRDLDEFKMTFQVGTPKQKKGITKEQATLWSKLRWAPLLAGVKGAFRGRKDKGE